jgi:hypothetical protein
MDNIRVDVGQDGMVWTGLILVKDRDQWMALVSMVMNFRVSKKMLKLLSSHKTCGF